MKIAAVTVENFRSFGAKATTIELQGITACVGPNGAGKSTLLSALGRLFGSTRSERSIEASDFHLAPGERLEDAAERRLRIEANVSLPELRTTNARIPPVFSRMVIEEEGAAPLCRIRLEATWSRTGSPQGEIDEQMSWVTTASLTPEETELPRMSAADRSLIVAHYIPAMRDPVRQLRMVSTTVLARLLRAAEWSPVLESELAIAADAVSTQFGKEPGMQTISTAITSAWRALPVVGLLLRAASGCPQRRAAAVGAVCGGGAGRESVCALPVAEAARAHVAARPPTDRARARVLLLAARRGRRGALFRRAAPRRVGADRLAHERARVDDARASARRVTGAGAVVGRARHVGLVGIDAPAVSALEPRCARLSRRCTTRESLGLEGRGRHGRDIDRACGRAERSKNRGQPEDEDSSCRRECRHPVEDMQPRAPAHGQ